MSIAVIGPTHSGKTMLVANLVIRLGYCGEKTLKRCGGIVFDSWLPRTGRMDYDEGTYLKSLAGAHYHEHD